MVDPGRARDHRGIPESTDPATRPPDGASTEPPKARTPYGYSGHYSITEDALQKKLTVPVAVTKEVLLIFITAIAVAIFNSKFADQKVISFSRLAI